MKNKLIITALSIAVCISATPMIPVFAVENAASIPIETTEISESEAAENAQTETATTIEETATAPTEAATDAYGDVDESASIIDAMTTRESAETPCQVNITAVVPERFNLASYAIITNNDTLQEYKLPCYKENKFAQRCFVPAGTYTVVEMAVFDDVKMQYPFAVSDNNRKAGDDIDQFTVDENNKTVDIQMKLSNFDDVQKTIDDETAEATTEEATVADEDEVKSIVTVTHKDKNGKVKNDKDSTKGLIITGKQTKEVRCIAKIIKGGKQADTEVSVSFDNGQTYSDPIKLGLSGNLPVNGSGIVLSFSGDFVAGDTYSFFAPDPAKAVVCKTQGVSSINADLVAKDPNVYPSDILLKNEWKVVVYVTKGGFLNGGKGVDSPLPVIRISLNGGKSYAAEQYMSKDGIVPVKTSDGADTGLVLKFTTANNQKASADDEAIYVFSTSKQNQTMVYAGLIAIVVILIIAFAAYSAKQVAKVPTDASFNINPVESIEIPDKKNRHSKHSK